MILNVYTLLFYTTDTLPTMSRLAINQCSDEWSTSRSTQHAAVHFTTAVTVCSHSPSIHRALVTRLHTAFIFTRQCLF